MSIDLRRKNISSIIQNLQKATIIHQKATQTPITVSKKFNVFRDRGFIYNIGTEILNFQCFLIKIMKLFCKWLIFSAITPKGPQLQSGGLKTRFKANLRNKCFCSTQNYMQGFFQKHSKTLSKQIDIFLNTSRHIFENKQTYF